MAIGSREVIITVNVDTGAVSFEKGANVQQTGDPTLEAPTEEQRAVEQAVGEEIAGIRRGTKRYLRVGEILQTNPAGCVYWDGVRWVKYC
jgi:hypothetical protein